MSDNGSGRPPAGDVARTPTGWRRLWAAVRRAAGRLLAVLFGLTAAWLLLELLLRVAYPIMPYIIQSPLRDVRVTPFSQRRILPPPLIQPDSAYQMVARAKVDNELQVIVPSVPMHVSTLNWMDPDSHVGFRVPSLAWTPRWPVDAVFVGDSFTFCFTEYDDCWVQILDQQYGLSAVNLGQGATASISHLNILRKFGLLYQPRFVVWQWYGNDFNEDYGMATTYLGLEPVDAADDTPPPPPRTPLAQWLSAHSALYALLDFLRSSAADRYRTSRFVDPYRFREEGLDIWFGRDVTIAGNDLSQEKNRLGMALSQQAIRDAREFLDSAGVPLVLVLIPSKEEVYRSWTEPVLGADVLVTIAAGRQAMNDFCRQERLPCLDATPVLTAAANAGQQVYYPRDNHINADGNALLAGAVWQFLVDEGLMPRTR